MTLHGLILFDIAAVVAMLVLAYLSKVIGSALKIAPYYRILYIASLMVVLAAVIDSIPKNALFPYSETISMALRCAASVIALPVCLRYWKWLISEYFKN